jgi:hypothetical protein
MAVVDVTQMWSRDGASVAGNKDDLPYRDFKRTTGFQVLIDDPNNVDINSIENAVGIPQIQDLYPFSDFVRCTNKVVIRHSPIFYQVDCEYTGDNSFTVNRPIITKSSITSSEPIDEDWNGRAIVNVNGEPVSGISRDVSDTQITITRNFISVNDDLVLDYLEATNSDNWRDSTGTKINYSPGRCRLTSYNAVEVFKNESTSAGYWKVTATIQCRRGYRVPAAEAWYARYRNEGLLVKGTGLFAGQLGRAYKAGEPTTTPVLLNSAGEEETDPDAAVYLTAQVYGSLPYASLGLL